MLSPSDLLRLPYTPDLTQAGVDYACRSLPYTYDRMGGSDFARLRRIVAGVAVELAFRRYLSAQDVPHDNLGATPFTDPDRYDVSLGGRRCDLKSFQIFQPDKINRIRADPAYLLQASALVPADQLASDHLCDDDLYLFAFATARVTSHQSELKRPQARGQTAFLIHPMPPGWTRPPQWASLGRLALKSESGPSLRLELGGQAASREFQTETITLAAGERTLAQGDFYSLGYLRVAGVPTGRVGVHSPKLDQTHVVLPHEWGNIWVYGMDVILAGYMTRGEFRHRSHTLPAGSQVLQYNRTRTPNQCLPVAELHPLSDLFARARQWAAQHQQERP